jgi:rSAM/selenodomain-associated transferase 1
MAPCEETLSGLNYFFVFSSTCFKTMESSKSLILFFVKFPDPGRVKTRISRVLGNEKGAAIYRAFVMDMMDTLVLSDHPLAVCFAPHTRLEAFRSWLGHGWLYLPQQGDHLGDRMKRAFQDAFHAGYTKAILIGSDFPDLPPEIILEAFSTLENHPAVIGPALDGGYYLIGFERETFKPSIFEGIEWGGDGVLKQTLSSFKEARERIHLLPAWNDIDTLDDLLDLYRRGKGTDFARSKTMACLATVFDRGGPGGTL